MLHFLSKQRRLWGRRCYSNHTHTCQSNEVTRVYQNPRCFFIMPTIAAQIKSSCFEWNLDCFVSFLFLRMPFQAQKWFSFQSLHSQILWYQQPIVYTENRWQAHFWQLNCGLTAVTGANRLPWQNPQTQELLDLWVIIKDRSAEKNSKKDNKAL